jgi:hypothetical protein
MVFVTGVFVLICFVFWMMWIDDDVETLTRGNVQTGFIFWMGNVNMCGRGQTRDFVEKRKRNDMGCCCHDVFLSFFLSRNRV